MTFECENCGRINYSGEVLYCQSCGSKICGSCADTDSLGDVVCSACWEDEEDDRME